MIAPLRLAAVLIVSTAVSPAQAADASLTLVSGVEPRSSLDAPTSDVPAAADKQQAETQAPSAEVRRAVRVVLPSPYGVPNPRP